MKLTQLEMGKCLKTILFPKRIVKRRRGKSITKQSPRKNHTDYSKRDLKEIAYTEIAEIFGYKYHLNKSKDKQP